MFARYTHMAIFGLLFFGVNPFLQAQSDTIYVKTDTTGANDGSSWEDAFFDLQSAFALAEEGDEIWVAQGTYFPDTMGGGRASTFLVDKNIKLLGGFHGSTGNNIPDPDQFITRLSGDLGQNDIPYDLDSNRADNVRTVLTVAQGVTGEAVIDGFYIQNGHATGDDFAFQNRRGGGCFSFGSPTVSRCVFDQNFAEAGGGGLYLHTGGAEGTQVSDCLFIENEAVDGGGAMCFVQGGDGVTFSDCHFSGNRGENGGGLRVYNSNVLLDNCNFQINQAERGGAMDVRSIWDDNETQIINTFFSENQARHGGAINFQTNSGLGAHNNFLTVDGCEFFGNQATINDPEGNGGRQGGAIRANIERTTNGCGVRIRNCDFTMNMSERDGGAIAAIMNGETMTFLLENSFVQDNEARNGGGVQIAASDVGSGTATIRGCDIIGNYADDNGGGVRLIGGESSQLDFVIEENQFVSNQCVDEGGAMDFVCRDTAIVNLKVTDTDYIGNWAFDGAVFRIAMEGGQLHSNFSYCEMTENNGELSGVFSIDSTHVDFSSLILDHCLIYKNVGGPNGLFYSLDFPRIELVNCTIVDNSVTFNELNIATEGALIQNCILIHSSTFYSFGGGIAISGGGNVTSDINSWMDGLDFMGVSLGDVFQSYLDYDFILAENSPAIDAGIERGDTPEFDWYGNERIVNCLDAGIVESPIVVASACNVSNVDENSNGDFALSISPNPAKDFIRLEMEVYFAEAKLELLDVNGQILRSEKISNTLSHFLDVSNLPSGVYFMRMTVDGGSELSRVVVR